jgi:hypothetical protein
LFPSDEHQLATFSNYFNYGIFLQIGLNVKYVQKGLENIMFRSQVIFSCYRTPPIHYQPEFLAKKLAFHKFLSFSSLSDSWEGVYTADMLGYGEQHFLQAFRVPLTVGQAVPQLMLDAALPKAEGGAALQLTGLANVLHDGFDIVPNIETMADRPLLLAQPKV